MEIVDYLVENVQFFVVGITPYYYEHGVFMEDHDGVRIKYRIQKLIYRDQVQIYIKGQWPFDNLILFINKYIQIWVGIQEKVG